ncbi:hypothetical protein V6R21_11205 [Limibacter armeniacum]|uniref:hypothetical protein n=1 Tax=Limibacter armeniacum TaxID=466084 RepID=UPI002FE5E1DB
MSFTSRFKHELISFENYLIKLRALNDKSGKSYYAIFETLEYLGELPFSIDKETFPLLAKASIAEILKEEFTEEELKQTPKNILSTWAVLKSNIRRSEKAHYIYSNLEDKGFENKFSKLIALHLIFQLCHSLEKTDIKKKLSNIPKGYELVSISLSEDGKLSYNQDTDSEEKILSTLSTLIQASNGKVVIWFKVSNSVEYAKYDRVFKKIKLFYKEYIDINNQNNLNELIIEEYF